MHRCMNCKKFYEDDEVPILEGCSCGSKFFIFIKNIADAEKFDQVIKKLGEKRVELEESIEKSAKEGKELSLSKELSEELDLIIERFEKEKPRKAKKIMPKFEVETIKMRKPGVYEINLEALLKGRPVIILKGQTYVIRLPSLFEAK